MAHYPFMIDKEEAIEDFENAATITLATAEGSWKTRDLKVRYRALRARVEEKWVEVEYCPGDLQLADGLTKILTSQRMTTLMMFWGLYELQDGPPLPVHRRVLQVRAPAGQQPTGEPQQQSTTELRQHSTAELQPQSTRGRTTAAKSNSRSTSNGYG